MASITIRQLDDDLKKRLRLRAAQHGRSMEDEVRTILRGAADARESPAAPAQERAARTADRVRGQATQPSKPAPIAATRILLIIGGGIAAYKSLDLIRRLQGTRRGRALRPHRGGAGIRHAARRRRAVRRGRVFTDLFDRTERIRRRPYPARARYRPRRRCAGDRRPDGQDGGRSCRRSRDRRAARDRPADPDRARDESEDVVAPGNAAQSRAARRRWRHDRRSERRRDGGARRGRHRPHGRAARDRRRGACAHRQRRRQAAQGQARDRHLGPDARADRSGALYRQSLLWQAGSRHRGSRRGGGRRGDAGFRTGERARSDRGHDRESRNRARDVRCGRERALPADCAVFAAAVADWRVAEPGREKIKKAKGATPAFALVENPDILATIAHSARRSGRSSSSASRPRPRISIANAKAKLARKGCDWIVANDVSPETGIMGGEDNSGASRDRRGRRILASAVEGRGRARAGCAHRRRACGRSSVNNGRAPRHAACARRGLPLPAYQSEHAAGLDLIAAVPADAPVTIAPGARAMIPTGICIALPPGTEGQVRPRSGLAMRHGVTVLNAPGTIDADYQRRNTGHSGESRPRFIHSRTRNADCAIGDRAYNASDNLRDCKP